MRLIDADNLKDRVHRTMDMQDTYLPSHFIEFCVDEEPTQYTVPWEFLMRYATSFCANVNSLQFIEEAKRFYEECYPSMETPESDDTERIIKRIDTWFPSDPKHSDYAYGIAVGLSLAKQAVLEERERGKNGVVTE